MKKLKFLTDHELHRATYKAGDSPNQWFANADADRLAEEGIAEIVEVDDYTKQCEAAEAKHAEHDPED